MNYLWVESNYFKEPNHTKLIKGSHNLDCYNFEYKSALISGKTSLQFESWGSLTVGEHVQGNEPQ
jgi:hypothetical protein